MSFVGNTAADNWGALFISESSLSWAADASFVSNIAGESGGSIFADCSCMSFVANGSFVRNIAAGNGCALFLDCSEVSWTASVSFINNASGDYTESSQGGGVYISNSDATWEGIIPLPAIPPAILGVLCTLCTNRVYPGRAMPRSRMMWLSGVGVGYTSRCRVYRGGVMRH